MNFSPAFVPVVVVRWAICLLLSCCVLLEDSPASAQYAQQPVSEAQLQQLRAQARQRRNQNRGEQPQPDQKPKEEKKEEEKSKEEEKKEDEIKTVKRSTERPTEVDPNRVKLQPDADGRVQFNYFGQAWADVLQDYADAAGYSFDWQELPADFLNLTTTRKYTLDEARAVLNQRLLARGFTLFLQGEVLSAVKIDKLDPSLVRRVEADDLEDYSPYEFVRVRFQLPLSMDPAKAAEDVKLLLSPNAKVTPLLATKRLLVIDTVANLRGVRDLLYAEQMAASSEIKPRIYQIRNRRADYVADQIMIVLGLDPSSRKTPQELQIEQQRMQLLTQMVQQKKDVSKMLQKDGPKVYIAVNRQQNSLLVNAPLDLIPIIERTIEQLDVGDGGLVGDDTGVFTMERYKTVTASTDSVITALKEIANLDPLTQLNSDSGSKTIFAYATARDHAKIQKMIGKLDGSGRRPYVRWLPPHLPADQVAGSIMALIVGGEEKEEEDNFPWYWNRRNNQKKEEPTNKGFRVLPDVENNRLLLWASEDEMAEVEKLIDMLERNPDGSLGDNRKIRRLEARDAEEIQRLLEQLRATWPGENELDIQVPAPAPQPQEEEPAEEAEESPEDQLTQTSGPRFWLAQAVVEGKETAAATNDQSATTAPPVKITVNSDGEIVIASEDTKALDQLQDLVAKLSPSQPEFHYFKLRYISASDVVYNLEIYFEDALAEEGERILDWWGRSTQTKPEPGPLTLGKRRPLRFIDDYMTNTVIVVNASPSQLKTIAEIIERYDQPYDAEDYRQRKTEVVTLKYSRATEVAASLKDVYRDLLSSKDKEFQDKEGRQSAIGGSSKGYVFEGVSKVRKDGKSAVVFGFEGALSVGVDVISNSLVISARAELMDNIIQTVKNMDEAARPKTVVRTHEVRGLVDADTLKQALSQALGQPWPGGKPMQTAAARGGGQKGQQTRGEQNQNGNERRQQR